MRHLHILRRRSACACFIPNIYAGERLNAHISVHYRVRVGPCDLYVVSPTVARQVSNRDFAGGTPLGIAGIRWSHQHISRLDRRGPVDISNDSIVLWMRSCHCVKRLRLSRVHQDHKQWDFRYGTPETEIFPGRKRKG